MTRPPAEPHFELELFLPYRLSVLTNTISQGIAGGYERPHGLSVTEWRILAVLGTYPGRTASEVTQRTAMDKVAISRAVKSLMSRGLIRRETDGSDRRRRKLFISDPSGQAVLRAVVPMALAYEKALMSVLNKDELDRLNNCIDRLQNQASTLLCGDSNAPNNLRRRRDLKDAVKKPGREQPSRPGTS